IDFTNDPLLQGRLFSYTDTQLSRLGSPNFHEIPINRPIAPLHNHQRDGHMRQTINQGRVAYEPNTLGGGCPFQAMVKDGGFDSYAERIDAHKVRERSESFFDHFSQATLFFNSQSAPEQDHIVNALRFELGKVETEAIRQRMLFTLSLVDETLASRVAEGLGIDVPSQIEGPLNRSIPADGDPEKYQPRPIGKPAGKKKQPATSPALSMANTVKGVKTRKIAILAADGFGADLATVKKAILAAGAQAKIIAPRLGTLKGAGGQEIKADFSFLTSASVLFDAIYVAGGEQSAAALQKEPAAIQFVEEAYKHCKAIAATGAGAGVLNASRLANLKPEGKQVQSDEGVVLGGDAQAGKVAAAFLEAVAEHRFWSREKK